MKWKSVNFHAIFLLLLCRHSIIYSFVLRADSSLFNLDLFSCCSLLPFFFVFWLELMGQWKFFVWLVCHCWNIVFVAGLLYFHLDFFCCCVVHHKNAYCNTDFNHIHSRHVCYYEFIALCHTQYMYECIWWYGMEVRLKDYMFAIVRLHVEFFLYLIKFGYLWSTFVHTLLLRCDSFFWFGLVWFYHMQITMQIGKKHKIFCCCCYFGYENVCVGKKMCYSVDFIAVCFYSVHA